MTPHRVDLLRRLYRYVQGRPAWLGLEHMLQREKEQGRLQHLVLGDSLGFSLHVGRRSDVELPGFGEMVRRIESGRVPEAQDVWNFKASAWVSDPGSGAD